MPKYLKKIKCFGLNPALSSFKNWAKQITRHYVYLFFSYGD